VTTKRDFLQHCGWFIAINTMVVANFYWWASPVIAELAAFVLGFEAATCVMVWALLRSAYPEISDVLNDEGKDL
jgi:hypothetical protein